MNNPQRTLNLFDTIMLVSGSMIGSGIFIVSADMSRSLGSPMWLLLCWVLSGVITLFAALSYGELAGMMPEAGGQFVYLKRAFGRMTAFVYGWTVFLVIQTGVIAAVAVAFAKFTGVFIDFFDEKNVLMELGNFKITSAQLLAIVSIAFLTWLNTRGIQNGKMIQRFFTSAKLVALFGLIVLGIIFGVKSGMLSTNFENAGYAFSTTVTDSGITTSPLQGFGLIAALGVAMIGSLFSSDAWNNVTFIAGEIKEPQRNIPMGLFIGTTLVTIIYVLANVAYLMLLPVNGNPEAEDVIGKGIMFAQNDRVGTAALFTVFGSTSQYIMAALIMVSTFGCNNGLILAGSRLFQSMAANGLFFDKAKELNSNGVPAKALIYQAIWASVLCLSGSYGDLLDYCTFASLIFYIVTIAGIFVLRKKEPDAPRPYKAFGYPIIPLLYILLAGFICIDLLIFKTFNTGMGVLIILLGIPVFYIFDRKNKTA
ncbi:MAG: amino acid permease [Bacteroidia bacterium]|nr:amino acid permease [Bacteroidia bacterium]